MSSDCSKDLVVLISGANSGIGLATAEEFKRRGYRLSLGARSLESLKSAFGPPDEHMLFNHFDGFVPQTATDWVARTVARFGRIDALINNAGMSEPVTIPEDNDEALDRIWAVNVKAPLRMTRLCLPYLEATGRGRIVNVGSLSGKRVRNANVGYNMSKFALMGLTHTTRHVSWEKGVRAVAVCPSFVRTRMSALSRKVRPEDMIPPETLAELIRSLVELPNSAAIAELLVNCRLEDTL
jgi:NAD(P)-dependent dehydrogenase (short-subunit alcohol dehydrogenase family)